ncbi:SPOR domain-containing protein [Amaricoccus sp. W119]|uniref:SPOR domain-containing protein n=1 Tax=Amaricoccus sp. W119 TaxID=3391833 RepID=UPI0039A5F863
MRDLLSDEYDSVAGRPTEELVPASLRRIAGAVLFLGVIGAMGLWSYRLGTRDANEVPVIKAMAGPARVAPEDPGGARAAHQGLEVNSVLAGNQPDPTGIAPAAPEPVALADEDAAEGDLVIAGTPIEPDAASRADGGPEAQPKPLSPVSIQNELAAMVASVAPVAAAEPEGEPGDAPGDDPGAAPVAGDRPMGRPSNLRMARTTAPVEAAPTRSGASVSSQPREVSSVAQGSRLVQLGAYDSEALAREAWGRLVARDGDLLGAKSLYVERTTSNARVFYRLRVAGFDSADETRQMCDALRGRGVDCIPVTLQ